LNGFPDWTDRANRTQTCDWKTSPFQYAQQFSAGGAGRAHDGDVITSHEHVDSNAVTEICRYEKIRMKSIHVSIRDQQLTVKENEQPIRIYPVSTSRFGIGTEEGSFRTPTGRFRVAEKIGSDLPNGTIFVGRIPLQNDEALPPTEDLITSRILWLDGLDEHNANTRDRYVYIHGTKHEDKVGTAASHGCVRMRNEDVIELFEIVDEGTPVVIEVWLETPNPKVQVPNKAIYQTQKNYRSAICNSRLGVFSAWSLGCGFLGEPPGNTSKALDKYVVVRVWSCDPTRGVQLATKGGEVDWNNF
jgi:lipoprotein-anchoring transpeptidase ErfK/SrfK